MLQVFMLHLVTLESIMANLICPTMCICDETYNEIQCKEINMPQFTFPNGFCPKQLVISNSNLTEVNLLEHHVCLTQLKKLHIINCGMFEIYPNVFTSFENLFWLNISENWIASLKPGIFKGLHSLEVLNIENNRINRIEMGVFIDLSHAITISLSDNLLTYFEAGTFNNLNHLRQLSLANNLIEEVKPEYFEGLHQLNKLYLNGNTLKVLQEHAFIDVCDSACLENDKEQPLQKLQYLYLQNNSIDKIEINAFKGLKNLAFLDLNNNKITKLWKNSFHGLLRLSKLNIENCLVREIIPGAFNGLGELHQLYLGGNNLKTLDGKCFDGLPNLMFLKISHGINSLPGNLFKVMPNLTHLNLDNNNLSNLHLNVTKDLKKLQVLSLEKNKIQILYNNMFSCLTNLIELKLDDNSIHTINDHAFNGMKHLQKINLRNNNICTLSNDTPITYYSPRSFRKPFMNLEKLTHLDLYGNCLENLALAVFKYLPKLRFLNLGNNKLSQVDESVITNIQTLQELILHENPLICDCSLKKIRNWLLKNNVNTTLHMKREPNCLTGEEWDIAFQVLVCDNHNKELGWLKKFGLFMIGPAVIVVIGLLSWVYTQMKKKAQT
ncbi:hypothetical protein C0J52_14527 [Blattella germanica]|nr:hypothetical protein C0J52_14527 [Blattella germanica]PSN37592.1 hypothetical protein C0J52_14527 [Blattella germanica]